MGFFDIFRRKKKKIVEVKEEKKVIKSFDEVIPYFGLTAEQLNKKNIPLELQEYFRSVNLSGEQLKQMPDDIKRAYFIQRNISIQIEKARDAHFKEIMRRQDEITRREAAEEQSRRVAKKIASGEFTRSKKKSESEEDEYVYDGIFKYKKGDKAAEESVRRKRKSWEREQCEANGCTPGTHL